MWKWLALAAGMYGVLCMWAVVAPHPPRVPGAPVANVGARLRDLPPLLPPGPGPPGKGPPGPGPAGAGAPVLLDFEQPLPGIVTRPTGLAEIVALPDGNHVLHWSCDTGRELAAAVLPLRAADPGVKELRLRLRADRRTPVGISLREQDGSVYATERWAAPEWRELVIPLRDLRPAPRYPDENGRLDTDQVQALVLVHLGIALGEWRAENRGPATFELDQIRLQ